MEQRRATRGPKDGDLFWGCSGYPRCRGTYDRGDSEEIPAAEVLLPGVGALSGISRALERWHERTPGKVGRPPPRPLILGGWAFSTLRGRWERWDEMQRWAVARGLGSLVPVTYLARDVEIYWSHAYAPHPRQPEPAASISGSLSENVLVKLVAYARQLRLCWKLGCPWCGAIPFSLGVEAVIAGADPGILDGAPRLEAWIELVDASRRLGPGPERAGLAAVAVDAPLREIARVAGFPHWLGYLGVVLADIEREPRFARTGRREVTTAWAAEFISLGGRESTWLPFTAGTRSLRLGDLEIAEHEGIGSS